MRSYKSYHIEGEDSVETVKHLGGVRICVAGVGGVDIYCDSRAVWERLRAACDMALQMLPVPLSEEESEQKVA